MLLMEVRAAVHPFAGGQRTGHISCRAKTNSHSGLTLTLLKLLIPLANQVDFQDN